MQQSRDELVAQLPHLRAFARSLTRGNGQLADDLVQDTVMLALRSWDSFTPGTNLKSWLLKILHNRFHSLARRKHVTAEIGDDDLLSRQSIRAPQEGRLEAMAFKRAFAELNPAHRMVLVLCAVQGLSYDEVATICDCEVGTVKSRVNRARALLKKGLFGDKESSEVRAFGARSIVGPAGPSADAPAP